LDFFGYTPTNAYGKGHLFVLGFFIHCETVAQGRRIHNGKSTDVPVCWTACVFGKADTVAKGHFLPAPAPCEPTVVIFTDDWIVCP
jgi:hypothetical protein